MDAFGLTVDAPEISRPAAGMAGWLKFVGVINIIVGVLNLILLIGILYIWMGVLLWQAGTAASTAGPQDIPRLLNKLQTYFIITGVLYLLGFGLLLLFFVVALVIGFGTFETVNTLPTAWLF